MEHVVHVVIFLLLIKEDFFLAILFQIFARRNQETRSATGRVADGVIRAGLHQSYHHFNNMAGGAELAV